jgi:hypothetical protein
MVMQRIANPPIPVRFRVSPPIPARVVKLVDTTDLKSVATVKRAYRFDSGSGHQVTFKSFTLTASANLKYNSRC